MKKTILLMAFLIASHSVHAGILEDFDSLGGNDVLVNRAKMLEPEKEVSIVQSRTVDRRWRNEFSAGYSNIFGGNVYLDTQMLSLDYHLHINPYWSVGLSYLSAYNQVSNEGRLLISADELVPDIDQPESGYELVGNFSPIYGKFNLFDLAIVQFDLYGIGTFGTMKLKSGNTSTFSYGAGFGMWISQHLTARVEIRQRRYEAQRLGGVTNIETTAGSLSFGYML